MAISLGPYQTGLPFITIQDIRFDVNKESEFILTVGLSNEKAVTYGRDIRNASFGNFIYFSSDKSEIDAIASDNLILTDIIKKNPKTVSYTHLTLPPPPYM